MNRGRFGRSRAEQLGPEQPGPEQPALEQPALEQPGPGREQPGPEQPAPERLALEQPPPLQAGLERPERTKARLEREQRRSFLKAAGAFVERYEPVDHRKLKPLPLTPRDVEVMHWLKVTTAAPVDVLASYFFATNPQTGAINSNPVRAATRRLNELARAGYLHASSVAPSTSRESGGRVYALGSAGAAAVGVGLKGITPKRIHHHMQTLRTVEIVRQELLREGKRVVGLELERGEMSSRERNSGRHVPDAIVTVDDGSTIAVEYVSTDYTDEMIRSKGAYFTERYSQLRWSANSTATRARVLRVTREPCEVIG
jgi:hypothetical protein